MGIAVARDINQMNPVILRQGEKDRSGLIRQISILTTTILGIISLVLVIYAIVQPAWQLTALAVIQFVAWNIAGFSFMSRIKHNAIRVYLLVIAILVMMTGMSIFVEGQAIPAALVALAYSIILTSVAISGASAEGGLSLGMIGAWLICLIGLIAPYEKVILPGSDISFVTILGIFVMVYVTLLTMEYITASLRIRLILSSLAIVIIPLLAVSLYQIMLFQNSVTERLQETLTSAANQTAFRVEDFLAANRNSVLLDSSITSLSSFLALPANLRSGSMEERDLVNTFEILKKRNLQFLVSYGLMDVSGVVVYDINKDEIGKSEGSAPFFYNSFRGQVNISDVIFSEEDNHPYIYFSSPVYLPENRNPIGILRQKYDANILQYILQDNTNLVGENTFPILVDENLFRLGDILNVSNLYKTLAPLSDTQAMLLRSNHRIPPDVRVEISTRLSALAGTLQNNPELSFFTTRMNPENPYSTSLNFIATSKLKNKPWTLLYTQDSSSVTAVSTTQERSTSLITAFLAGIVAMFSAIFARELTRPITRLTIAAQKITGGDLTVSAPVSNDEIGTLANAFNIMTGRLRQFINELEDRVRSRTSELAERNEALTFRNRQIQTIAEVARTIVSSQDLESLLNEVTSLVSGRFNFYHVGIFLLDENQEFAVLRAANSAGGKRMLARQHKLAVGQTGMVGFVTSKGQPRIATDVGLDAVFFNNPDLPQTRSEMALPLIGSGQVIGALDVQSTQSNAFSDEDVELFTTLADQVAIAILNSRAFEQSRQALEEARLVHQQYLHQEWNREIGERLHYTYEYTPRGVVARDRQSTPEIDSVFSTGESIIRNTILEGENCAPAIMGIPIKLRGETIGIIHLQDEGATERIWAAEDIQTVQSIADQVAQALENARLFEQTVRRADRERKVLEITSKIRATTDPQAMMQIAIEELQHALRASRTQVILNRADAAPPLDQPSNNNHSAGSNGNGKSG